MGSSSDQSPLSQVRADGPESAVPRGDKGKAPAFATLKHGKGKVLVGLKVEAKAKFPYECELELDIEDYDKVMELVTERQKEREERRREAAKRQREEQRKEKKVREEAPRREKDAVAPSEARRIAKDKQIRASPRNEVAELQTQFQEKLAKVSFEKTKANMEKLQSAIQKKEKKKAKLAELQEQIASLPAKCKEINLEEEARLREAAEELERELENMSPRPISKKKITIIGPSKQHAGPSKKGAGPSKKKAKTSEPMGKYQLHPYQLTTESSIWLFFIKKEDFSYAA